MNILVLTHSISPYRGSECAVGWNYVKYMSSTGNRLYVLFGGGKNDKEDIDKYLSVNKMGNVSFIYAGSYDEHINWKHLSLAIIKAIGAYREWMKKMYVLASRLVEKYDIDIVHYLNPIGFKEPGYLWKLDKPYMWGPLQGVQNFPLSLYSILGKRGLVEAVARLLLLNYKFFLDPRVRKAFKRTDLLIAATPKTKRDLKRFYNRDCLYLPENAIEIIEADEPIAYHKGECLNIISVGTLCDRKGFILQLKAAERLLRSGYGNFKWTIVGSGYLEAALKRYSSAHGLNGNVVFTGQITRDEVQKLFKQAHLNVISSLSEGTPTVIWEAMAKGIPTMTLDHCGMGGVLSDDDSFKVKVAGVSKVVGVMAETIISIFNEPLLIAEKSRNTLAVARKNTWERRVGIIEKLYNEAIELHRNKK